jgi:hypothetical protein
VRAIFFAVHFGNGSLVKRTVLLCLLVITA